MGNWFLRNGLVYRDGLLRKESVLVLNGQTVAFGLAADYMRSSFSGMIREYDATNCVISRGFIDLHVHLREPGYEDKETIATGTLAAAAGGFTNVCPMPNTDPSLDTIERLDDLQTRIRKDGKVHVHPIAALTIGRKGQEFVDYDDFASAGVLLFSDDGDPLQENIAEQVFLKVKKIGGVVINHLEDKSLVKEGFFYEQIPPSSEFSMLIRDIKLVKKTGCRYHAAHLSCIQSVELIAEAKRMGLPVTAEVTPHHLTLTHLDIAEPPGHFQMKPPLRTEYDRLALVEGLKSGVIDVVATDHAPHGKEKEDGLFAGSPFGITGLETAFPVLYSYLVLNKHLSLERLLSSLTEEPAKILDVQKTLEIGKPADLVVVNLERGHTLAKGDFRSKGTNNPYISEKLRGWPVLTLLNGKEVFSIED